MGTNSIIQSTPGPWKYQGVGASFLITAAALHPARHVSILVARADSQWPGYEPISQAEAEANARLISLAPVLRAERAALRAALNRLDLAIVPLIGRMGIPIDKELQETLAEVNAALFFSREER